MKCTQCGSVRVNVKWLSENRQQHECISCGKVDVVDAGGGHLIKSESEVPTKRNLLTEAL